MAQPTPYSRLYDLTTYARNNPAAPYNAAYVDAELDAIETTLDETLANLAAIQSDDGGLRIGVVTPDSLDTATLNLMGSWAPKGPWLPAQSYAVLDMVTINGTTSYVCATAHTSSSFAIELAAGYWQQVNGATSDFGQIAFTTGDRILGRVTAGAGPGEEIVCLAFARTLLDDADAATARTTLGIGSASNPSFGDVTVTGLTITGIFAPAFIYIDSAHEIVAAPPASSPTNGQLLVGSTGVAPVVANITGTANQVVVTNGAGSITLSLPQSIAATNTPTFGGLSLTNLAQGAVVFIGPSSALSQDIANLVWDDTNNRLGIGTATPSGTLELSGTGGGTPTLVFEESGDTFTWESAGGALFLTSDTGVPLPMFQFDYDGVLHMLSVLTLAGTAPGSWDIEIRREAAGVLGIRQSTTAQTIRGYRTFTDASNYERWALQSGAGYFELAAETAGTGTDNIDVRITPVGTGVVRIATGLLFPSDSTRIQGDFSNATRSLRMAFQDKTTNNATAVGAIPNGTSNSASFIACSAADQDNCHRVSIGATAINAIIDVTSIGTGSLQPLVLAMNTTARFLINTSGVCNVASATATPAAGSSTACLLFGTTTGFGIYYGSGAPTVSAGQGSIYLRSDGSSTSTRLYVNTDGGTTWTNVTTAA